MATSHAGLLAIENMSAALRKGRLSPQAVEGILKGHAVFGPLGEAFLRGEISLDRLSALLAPTTVPVTDARLPVVHDWARAERIMGKAFVSPYAYVRRFRLLGVSNAELSSFVRVPWPDDVLAYEAEIQPSGLPRSILWPHLERVTLPLAVHETIDADQANQPCFSVNDDWWQSDGNNGLRDKRIRTSWLLVRTHVEPGTTDISWDAQSSLIPVTHERTWTLEAVEMAFLAFRAFGIRPLETLCGAWCQDVSHDRHRICAGGFGPDGLSLSSANPSRARNVPGLLLSRKPSQP